MVEGGIFIKSKVYLIIGFVIFLVIVIISGRILNEINLSSCTSDSHIKIAHSWAAWVVGISSTVAGILLILFIVSFFI
ncbi:putative ORFan [Tupanvirus deep ocean]|uniref:ORFan n=2 Tax=Tupanvirus TaxID=2094720 RepID=A0AC62A9L8_9VIRU|nr:putative ORFan [Tupanvirus deep ocean]QKU34445.1 putative ORFan [Tupanvirus deep ocean]